MYFTLLGMFVPRYFLFFEAIMNGRMFMTSLSVFFVFVHIEKLLVCASWLHPAMWLNVFITSKSFLVEILWPLIITYNVTSVKRDSLTYSFLFEFNLLLLHCTLVNASSTLLKGVGTVNSSVLLLISLEWLQDFFHSVWCCLWISYL